MTTKYRVDYYESESGWGSDSWSTYYDTEEEAKEEYQYFMKKYMGKPQAPDYYVCPTYIGAVEV